MQRRKLTTEERQLITKYDKQINSNINYLWNNKFKPLFSALRIDYDEFKGISYLIICQNVPNWDGDQSSFMTFCNMVLQRKLNTYATAQNRQKRAAQTYAESIYQRVSDDNETELVDLVEDEGSEINESSIVVERVLNSLFYKKERKVFKYFLDGYAMSDIARIMRMSEKTVSSLIKDICSRPEVARIVTVEVVS